MIGWLLGCAPPVEPVVAPGVEPGPIPSVPAPVPTPSPTGDTGSTVDCDGLPDVPLSVTEYPIETTEDFDFDAGGWLIYAANGALLGVDLDGNERLVALGIGSYARGIQVLASGDVVVADYNVGRLLVVDHLTGGLTTLTASLQEPNGLEIGEGDVVYVTDTSVGHPSIRAMRLDGGSEDPVPVGGMVYPNGLALNEAEDTMYIADLYDGLFASHRQTDGSWDVPEPILEGEAGASYDTVEVDVCGNVYTVEFTSGRLYRVDAVTGEGVLLVDLDDPAQWLWNSMRWGSDRGGWRRDVLYVTNRHKVFGVELGVRGRSQPLDAR